MFKYMIGLGSLFLMFAILDFLEGELSTGFFALAGAILFYYTAYLEYGIEKNIESIDDWLDKK